MKLISLNAWMGREFKAFSDFFKDPKNKAEIYSFQEITSNIEGVVEDKKFRANFLEDLKKLFPDFQVYFYPFISDFLHVFDYEGSKTTDHRINLGTAILVRKDIKVLEEGGEWIFNDASGKDMDVRENNLRRVHYIKVRLGIKEINIFNCFGIPYPGTKRDTPERLEQSKRILEFVNSKTSEKILCGDFNLEPDTKSIQMIEEAGFKNLIKEFNIKDTRGPINHKLYEGISTQHFADFTFASNGVEVKSFSVPYVPIADHLPMILEFE